MTATRKTTNFEKSTNTDGGDGQKYVERSFAITYQYFEMAPTGNVDRRVEVHLKAVDINKIFDQADLLVLPRIRRFPWHCCGREYQDYAAICMIEYSICDDNGVKRPILQLEIYLEHGAAYPSDMFNIFDGHAKDFDLEMVPVLIANDISNIRSIISIAMCNFSEAHIHLLHHNFHRNNIVMDLQIHPYTG